MKPPRLDPGDECCASAEKKTAPAHGRHAQQAENNGRLFQRPIIHRHGHDMVASPATAQPAVEKKWYATQLLAGITADALRHQHAQHTAAGSSQTSFATPSFGH